MDSNGIHGMNNYIKNKTLFQNPLILDGEKIFNPTEEQLLAAGYKRYIPAEADHEKLAICDGEPDYQETEKEIRLVYRYTFSEAKAQKHYCRLAQDMMDARAQERHYDGIMSACSYATSRHPKFASEAAACVLWRDTVWAKCYEMLDAVKSGEMDIPSEKAFLEMLPAFNWPDETEEINGQTA